MQWLPQILSGGEAFSVFVLRCKDGMVYTGAINAGIGKTGNGMGFRGRHVTLKVEIRENAAR